MDTTSELGLNNKMRTSSKFIIALSVLLFPFSSRSEMTLDWERDLSVFGIASNNVETIKQYSDGSIAVLLGKYGETNIHIIVYEANGDLRFNDSSTKLSQEQGYIAGQSSQPTWIMLNFQYYELGSYLMRSRIYEVNGTNYSVTETSIYNATEYNRSWAGVDPRTFVLVDGAMLRKYTLSSTPTDLNASVISGIDGLNYIIHWNTKSGQQYQIQSSHSLTNDWSDVGEVIVGTGDPLTWANALTNSKAFYRVIEK